jgi:putative transposase
MSDSRRQFTEQRYIHFFTFSVYRRRRLLDLDQRRRIVLGTLTHLLERLAAKCLGFVVMPNHVPAPIWLNDSPNRVRFEHGCAGGVGGKCCRLAVEFRPVVF